MSNLIGVLREMGNISKAAADEIEDQAFMIDHLKKHIHQLCTGQVPMPNGQYVANPIDEYFDGVK